MVVTNNDRLQQALAFANYKSAVHTRKMHLKAEMEDALHYAFGGGMFKIDKELMTFVDYLIRLGHTEAVLIDSRSNPVMVEGLAGFLENVTFKYFEATNGYHNKCMQLNRARTVEQVAAI